MKRILFVDDEPNILAGLKRMLMRERKEWDMHFAQSGAEALTLLEASDAFDVVVSDMKMPVMQGYELLEKVAEKWPGVSRLILSGHAEHESALRSAGVAHQFISKPCDPEVLRSAVTRTCALRERLAQNAIADALAGLNSLPVLPQAFREINEELALPEPSLKRVADILAADVAMSVKILQLVNSSYFGLPRKIESISQATMLLGLNTLRDLVLSTSVFRAFKSEVGSLNTDALWRHGRRAAKVVGIMCTDLKLDPLTAGELRVAAFVQDVGQLALASVQPDNYKKVMDQVPASSSLIDAEMAVFGTQHAAVGAYILGLWGIPEGIVEAVYFHHNLAPPSDLASQSAGMVAIANEIMAATANPDPEAADQLNALLKDTSYSAHIPSWLERASNIHSNEDETDN